MGCSVSRGGAGITEGASAGGGAAPRGTPAARSPPGGCPLPSGCTPKSFPVQRTPPSVPHAPFLPPWPPSVPRSLPPWPPAPHALDLSRAPPAAGRGEPVSRNVISGGGGKLCPPFPTPPPPLPHLPEPLPSAGGVRAARESGGRWGEGGAGGGCGVLPQITAARFSYSCCDVLPRVAGCACVGGRAVPRGQVAQTPAWSCSLPQPSGGGEPPGLRNAAAR